jgi:undecaprenyl pyrophosphate phosphatase UppP
MPHPSIALGSLSLRCFLHGTGAVSCRPMSVLEAIVLGAVQGLTEFIPISSSGHLVIVPELFGWHTPGLVAQAISIFPGIARSGSTIAAGLGVGMARDDSARFAFLLAIPALFGAALVKVPDLGSASLGAGAAVAGFIASLLTSYAAIWGLIRYLKTRNLYPFAAYCVIAGIVFYILL